MTYKEALEKIKECGLNIEEPLHSEVMELVCEALEKQIPQKVSRHSDMTSFCIECGNTVKSYQSYCYECGQALDWSDIK